MSYVYNVPSDKPIACAPLKLKFPACGAPFRLFTPYDGLNLRLFFRDKFGIVYATELTADANGALDVNPAAFPPALFSPFAGVFEVWLTYPDAPTDERLYFEDENAFYTTLLIDFFALIEI